MMKPKSSELEKSKIEEVIKLAKITMPTLMKLLDIRMLANSSSGLLNKLSTNLLLRVPFSSSSSNSVKKKKKKATSDPEISAEQKSNMNTTRISITIIGVIGLSTI